MGVFTKVYQLSGLSTDTKPVDSSIAPGSTFTETDTGNVYSFNKNKNTWVKTSASNVNAEAPCVGIYSIDLTKSEGKVDTYTIKYTNGAATTFKVSNGDEVIINKYFKPLMADKLYTLDLKYDSKEKFQLYKILHLDNAVISEDTITSEEIPADKFWPRTEEGRFILANKEAKIELVFNYVGKNKTDNECWEAIAVNQKDEFVRYVGRFHWADPEDHVTRGYYFKAKKQTLDFKLLDNAIKVVAKTLNNEIERAKKTETALNKSFELGISKVETSVATMHKELTKDIITAKNIAINSETVANAAAAKVDKSVEDVETIKNQVGILYTYCDEKTEAARQSAMAAANESVNALSEEVSAKIKTNTDLLRSDLTTNENHLNELAESVEDRFKSVNDRIDIISTKSDEVKTELEAKIKAAQDDCNQVHNALSAEIDTKVGAAKEELGAEIANTTTTLGERIDTVETKLETLVPGNVAETLLDHGARLTDLETNSVTEHNKLTQDIADLSAQVETNKQTCDARAAGLDDKIDARVTADISFGEYANGKIPVTLTRAAGNLNSDIVLPTELIAQDVAEDADDLTIKVTTLDGTSKKVIVKAEDITGRLSAVEAGLGTMAKKSEIRALAENVAEHAHYYDYFRSYKWDIYADTENYQEAVIEKLDEELEVEPNDYIYLLLSKSATEKDTVISTERYAYKAAGDGYAWKFEFEFAGNTNFEDEQLAAINSGITSALVNKITSAETALESKVDKVDGKGLSDENYTKDEKDFISGLISNYVSTINDLTERIIKLEKAREDHETRISELESQLDLTSLDEDGNPIDFDPADTEMTTHN